jgi:thioredoxin reductase (NADPH)
MQNIENTVIIGSGPAGYTSAIYLARAMLNPLMITGIMYGGQLMQTTEIENFPGVYSTEGEGLMNIMNKQAENFGTTYKRDDVVSINTQSRPFRILTSRGEEIQSKSIIITTGAKPVWLDIEGEENLRGNGLSTCATCDGFFFKNKEIIVVGGGDSAFEEAIFLSRYASKVTIVHRRRDFRASKIMINRAVQHGIHFKVNFRVTQWLENESFLSGAILESTLTGEKESIEFQGAFIAIGHHPNTEFLQDKVELDNDGYIITGKSSLYNTMTSVEGIFAGGDCVDKIYRQAITSAGMGCSSALDCIRWLENNENHKEDDNENK